MDRSIALAADVGADAPHVFHILATSEGQRGLWTADCDVDADPARFAFPQAPIDLITETDLGYTAQTWAMILARLSTFASTGNADPLFPAAT
jgi:hypothetical protein